ncbi:MAG: phytanoyl-CoA dioxygenase family protein [Rhodospirillales bacterium]|nr:phytanoyl-CoA dioxygenase family protein [Rhodospirillales bacterium]
MLRTDQIEAYRRDGYLVVPGVIRGETLATLRRLTDELVAAARGVRENDELYDLEPSHTPEMPRVRRLKPAMFKRHAFFGELTRDPAITSLLAPLLGPDIRLHGGKLNMKSAAYGSPVEWHQDWAFYPHTNDDVLATGIYLDDCDGANGPLLVVPGTHRGPTWNHHADGRFCGAMDPAACAVDFAAAVPLTGPAGSMTIHHARLVHGSALNTSNRTRRLLLHEYAAADAWPLMGVKDLEEFDSRMVLGRPTLEPRVAAAPVRMPLPAAANQGSIYENQRAAGGRFFETYEARRAAG